jgi:Mn-dependent DtxR family transcriptional regulator
MITDGRGKNKTATRIANEEKIAEYVANNEGTTITECARALNLHPVTVSNAIKRLGVKRG